MSSPLRTPAAADQEASTLALVDLFLVTPIMAAYRGLIISFLWSWFVVPLGFPAIGVWHAAGISLLFSFLALRLELDKETPQHTAERMGKRIGSTFIIGVLTFVFGAIYNGFAS